MKLYEEFQKYNVFRVPSWRWDRVKTLVEGDGSQAKRASPRDDKYVKAAHSFLKEYKNAKDQEKRELLWWKYTGLYYAFDIFERRTVDPYQALCLEARILAKQSPEYIAHVLGTIPETIFWYEKLYFNVSDRLENRDWITTQVLMPAVTAPLVIPAYQHLNRDVVVGTPFFDSSLKLFSYFGGPHLCDLFLSGFQAGKPMPSSDDVPAWMDSHWKTTVKKRSMTAATTFILSRYDVVELFKVHAAIIALEHSDEADESRRTSADKHIRAMMDELPFSVGKIVKMIKGSKVGQHDDTAAELRDDELQRAGAGEDIDTNEFPKELPPPRRPQMIGTSKGKEGTP